MKEQLILQEYQASIFDDSEDNIILGIYLGFSGLQFTINANNELVLTEEMWYDKGCVCVCGSCEIKIDKPSIGNIIK